MVLWQFQFPLLYCVFSVDVDALADDEFYNVPSFLVCCYLFGYRIYFFDYMCLCLYDSLRRQMNVPSPKYQEVDDSQEEDENVTDK